MTAVCGLGAWAWLAAPGTLEFAVWGVAILFVTAVWEWVSYHGGWVERMERMGLPVPRRMHERFQRRRAEHEAGQR